jgi:bifunctional non-homologous end joining protein LigD
LQTIVGYVPSGRLHISALRLGKREGDAVRYVGKVGTGFSNEVSEQLRKQLSEMHFPKPTLTERLRKPDTKWVKPDLKAKIAYRGITREGMLRHPSFKGLKPG